MHRERSEVNDECGGWTRGLCTKQPSKYLWKGDAHCGAGEIQIFVFDHFRDILRHQIKPRSGACGYMKNIDADILVRLEEFTTTNYFRDIKETTVEIADASIWIPNFNVI